MDTWIGDWVTDRNKRRDLTEQRAVDDIWAMHESPDYTDREMKRAMRVAADHFDLRPEEFLVLTQFLHDAN